MNTDPAVVLVVDDEPRMAELVQYALEAHGLLVHTAHDATTAWTILGRQHVDLIILDVMLPGESGVQLCRRLRSTSDIPVILLTALSAAAHRVDGLEAGADDYVTKPFSPRELGLRAKAILRRRQVVVPSPATPPSVTGLTRSVGPLTVDLHSQRVTAADRDLRLTPGEFRLLVALSDRPGQTVHPRTLAQAMGHGPQHVGAARVVKTCVYRLRAKLSQIPGSPAIVNDRGNGYVLVTVR